MSKKIERVGVLGAGVMGATIAAQLANVGIETVLLDIVPPEFTDEDKKKIEMIFLNSWRRFQRNHTIFQYQWLSQPHFRFSL